MKTIPHFHEVPPPKNPWWSNPGLGVLAMLACFMAGLQGFSHGIVWIAVLSFALMLVLFLVTILFSLVISMGRGANYYRELRNHPVQDVILASKSPEYSEESRKEMILFLNANHKGWSMGNSAST